MPEKYKPEISSSSHTNLPSFLMEDDTVDNPLWDLLSVYADGEATEAEQLEIDRLLLSDPTLARELNLLQATHHILANITEVAPPSSLQQSILIATTQRPTFRKYLVRQLTTLRQQALPIWGRYALPVGSVALIAGLTYGAFTSHSNHQEGRVDVADVRSQTPLPTTPVAEPVAPKTEPLFPQGTQFTSSGTAQTPKQQRGSVTNVYGKEGGFKGSSGGSRLEFAATPQNTRSERHFPYKATLGGTVKLASLKTTPPQEGGSGRTEMTPLPLPSFEFTPKPMMDKVNQKPKDPVMMMATYTFTDDAPHSTSSEAPATTPKATDVEMTPEQRRKSRIEQARLLLKDANSRATRSAVDVSYHGNSDEDSTKVVDNLKKIQSSAFVLRRF